jgi:hypothetical protein
LTKETPSKAAFSPDGWRALRQTLTRMRQPEWLRRSSGCFVYDARQDIWVKETFGAAIRTPFTDTALFRAAQMWSRWSAARNARPDKTILARAVGPLLPAAVLERKGKVAYDGVWMRAYAKHGEHIAATLERVAPVLERIGLAPAWLVKRVKQLASWQPVSGAEVLGAYAIAVWLIAWDLKNASRLELE